MQEAVPLGTGRMAAVIGLDIEKVGEACKRASSDGFIAVPANINSPEQVVISGHKEAVERAMDLLKEAGAKKVIPLHVSAPSHSPLMRQAAERLKGEIEKIEVRDAAVPVISNVMAEPVEKAELIKGLLIAQLTSPVEWVRTIRCLKDKGVNRVIEIGPGRVLTGLAGRIEKDMECFNISSPEDMDSAIRMLEGA
jgi:[acyl-carrier-protein] S-malonyltransferase